VESVDPWDGGRPGWRECDLHELRVKYAALLADISWHRYETKHRGGGPQADQALWAILDKEGL